MINSVNLIGNLTRDPETRTTTTGKTVTTFGLAVNRFNDACDFIQCVAWDRMGEAIARNTSKGTQLAVSGRLQSRQYEDKTGVKRTILEVVVTDFLFCGKKEHTATPAPVSEGFSTATSQDFIEITEDDDPHLPF